MDLKFLQNLPSWEWPAEAEEMILEVLTDEQAEEANRLVAAELAGDYVVLTDRIVECLVGIVKNADESNLLRATAVVSLGTVLESADLYGFEDDDEVPISEETFHAIQASLEKIYHDPEESKIVRRRVLEASCRAPQEWHRKAIEEVYISDDDEWVLTAVFAMRLIRGFEEQILEALKSENEEIHFQAICAAGASGVERAWGHIAGIIGSADPDKDYLIAAMEAAPNIHPEMVGEVVEEWLYSKDDDIREAAQDALSMASMITGQGIAGDDEPEEMDLLEDAPN